jgi:HD-GYP domain-containing protein (c-di-GMP phosphodiesterase class II)
MTQTTTRTETILNRLTSYRETLGQSLVPLGPDPVSQLAEQLAATPEFLNRALQALTENPPIESAPPVVLTARARQLLEMAREMVSVLRESSQEEVIQAADPQDKTSLAHYHSDTLALTTSALRMAASFPASAQEQLRLCEGLDAMLGHVRERLAILQAAISTRSRDASRRDGLASRLTHLSQGRVVDLQWFAQVGEELLDEARQAHPIRWHVASASEPAKFVASHSLNVAQVVARLTIQDFEWSAKPLTPVVGAMLMDLGMLQLPAELLAKSGPLSVAERRMLETHPEAGAQMLANLYPDSAMTTQAIRMHHEHPDGTGYPVGHQDHELSSLSKMLRVADVYVAQREARPFRAAKDPRAALMDTLLAAETGTVDREFAEQLVNLGVYPLGTLVELADGRLGLVTANHPHRLNVRASARPVLALVTDFTGAALPRPQTLDLAATDRGSIVRAIPTAERAEWLGEHFPEWV